MSTEGRRVAGLLPASIGLRPLALPSMPEPVRGCLSRMQSRQVLDEVGGRPLWLPRLGVTVLPHELAVEGWLCTLVAADSAPERLPTGVVVVGGLEIGTAMSPRLPWYPVAGLTVVEYADAWRVRLVGHRRAGRYLRLGEALITAFDPDTLTVVETQGFRSRSGCRTTAGFAHACAALSAAGFLTRLDGDRWGLTVPPSPWPPP